VGGIEDFFAGFSSHASQLVGDPTRHIHNWGFAGFVQDDWRIAKNLTVNLGLRYELNTVVKEEHDLLGNFSPTVGLEQVGKQIKSPYNGDHKDFAPRLGFAWDITGNGRTVVRGGFGLMYETLNWESFLALENSLGLSSVPTGAIIDASGGTAGGKIAVGTVNFTGTDPNNGGINWDPAVTGIAGTVFPTTPLNCFNNPCSMMGVDPNLKTPYVLNWSLNVQHAFTPNLSLEVGYVGNHGSRLVGIRDINQVNPALDDGSEQLGRPFNAQFPYLAQIFQMENIYRSNYDGLQTTLTARNFHGLSMVAGYTYSHALDMVGANWDFGAGNGLPTDSTKYQREYASSDFDIRHRLTLSFTYLVPGKKGSAHMLEGWQINTITTLNSAQPWGVMDAGTDVSLTGELNDRWNFYGNPKDFKSTPVGIPFFQPGTPINPGDPTFAINNPLCATPAATQGSTDSLLAFGCYANGRHVRHHGTQHLPRYGIQERGSVRRQELQVGRAFRCAIPRRILQHPQSSELRESLRRTEWMGPQRSFRGRRPFRLLLCDA
jgi:outer membrane receptor protein involved in Fe transport